MAFWEVQEQGGAMTFQTGGLELSAGDAAWTSEGLPVTSAFHAAPGTSLTYTQEFDVVMEGDSLAATVEFNPGAITQPAGANYVVTAEDITGVAEPSGTAGVWNVTGSGTLTLSFTLTWARGDALNNAGQGGTISVAAGELLITQVANESGAGES